MAHINIRIDGSVGWITLNRPKALNALTHDMCLAIEAALDRFEADDAVTVIALESVGDKAFCAGGDVVEMHRTASAGDFAYGRKFWTDEYRLNAKLATGPKPIVSFLQGYTMGGGVGIGCHVPHRFVTDTSRIAMPEVCLGLVPDVGGSLILSRAPGRVGEYLGTTAARMGPGDAIFAGFADHYLPQEHWDAAKAALSDQGTVAAALALCTTAPDSDLAKARPVIDAHFAGETLGDIVNALRQSDDAFAMQALDRLSKNSPLAMAAGVDIIHRLRGSGDIVKALDLEYRFTYRAASDGDFIEGIRALIIDKDKSPVWQHALDAVPAVSVANMLMPLGADSLNLTEPS